MKVPLLNADVRCPADRGNEPYVGRITEVGSDIRHNHAGKPYVWTTVRHPSGTRHVWPSNRLTW